MEGEKFIPGNVGLNNLKKTDYINCIIQLVSRVNQLRTSCLKSDLTVESSQKKGIQVDPRQLLSIKFAELLKKMWNPINFKGHISPQEFV